MAETINSKSDTNNEIKWVFQELFTEKREELGLSVRELGAKAEVSYTVIYDLEQRGVLPKMETILKLAKALGFIVNIKKMKNKELPALTIAFHENENITDEKLVKKSAKESRLKPEEQLRRLLKEKGLYTNEIEEIESYIAFKLSQH